MTREEHSTRISLKFWTRTDSEDSIQLFLLVQIVLNFIETDVSSFKRRKLLENEASQFLIKSYD